MQMLSTSLFPSDSRTAAKPMPLLPLPFTATNRSPSQAAPRLPVFFPPPRRHPLTNIGNRLTAPVSTNIARRLPIVAPRPRYPPSILLRQDAVKFPIQSCEQYRKNYLQPLPPQQSTKFRRGETIDFPCHSARASRGVALDKVLSDRSALRRPECYDVLFSDSTVAEIQLRIRWPGYKIRMEKISIYNDTSGHITREQLAVAIAEAYSRYVTLSSGQLVTGSYEGWMWRLGEKYLTIANMHLKSVVHVADNVWQADMNVDFGPF